ncbi:MAG TPA: TIGR01777 family oxidoreductase [Gemmataceae bacterium]|nr:TIGR01777 family oxidoreductase [Gemmataceae bacterium]
MKIILPGGSGQVGTVLARKFIADGHDVVVLSRQSMSAPWRIVPWDGATLGAWAAEIDGADVVINLAGRSVDCRYHAANRRAIMDSRINSTRVLGDAIARAKLPPRVWLQASTATIYAHRYDAANDEATGILGGDEPAAPDTWRFSIDVAKAWEQTCLDANTPATRKVLLRSAMTMSPDHGGVFDVLLRLVRFGLGGTTGDGRQFVSWIHVVDFTRAIDWLIEHDTLSGPINLASPHPLPNAEFMRELRTAWGHRIGLPAPAWLVELGAFVLRTESELVLKSRRVVPGSLLESGFRFAYPIWHDAAADLCRRWRQGSLESTSANPFRAASS